VVVPVAYAVAKLEPAKRRAMKFCVLIDLQRPTTVTKTGNQVMPLEVTLKPQFIILYLQQLKSGGRSNMSGGGGVDWIRLAQDRDRWRAVVGAVMNLRVLAPRS
jgi:hypothetical protein